jgi:hypothetical protein
MRQLSHLTGGRTGRPAQKPNQEMADAIVQLAHTHPAAAVALVSGDLALATVVSRWGESALQAASHLGHRDLLSHLRGIGVEFDLFAACAIGDHRLIQSCWRTDSRWASGIHCLPLLHFGIVSRDLSVVDLLLDLGAPLNPQPASLSPLHSAVAIGSLALVQYLLAAGASTTAVDVFGATASDWACRLEDDGSELLNCFRETGAARQ